MNTFRFGKIHGQQHHNQGLLLPRHRLGRQQQLDVITEQDRQRLSGNEMRWNNVSHPKYAYHTPEGHRLPRLHMPLDEWVEALKAELHKSLLEVFAMCLEHLEPPNDDETDPYLIDRFLLQDEQYIAQLRTFLIRVKHETITQDVKQLYDGRQWAKKIWQDASRRVRMYPNIWRDILGRAAVLYARWGPFPGLDEKRKEILINEYIKYHDPDDEGKLPVHMADKLNQQYATFEFNATITVENEAHFVSFGEWNEIKWAPTQKPAILICPGVFFLVLGIPFHKSKAKKLDTQNTLNRCAKCGTLPNLDIELFEPVYNTQEFLEVKENLDIRVSGSPVFESLYNQSMTLNDKYLEMDNKQKQYLKKVDYNFLTTLFLTAGDGYGQSTDFKPLRNLFGFFTGKDYLKETLKQLIIVFSSVGQGFGEIETILGHHIIENKTKIPYNATGVKKQKRLGLAKPDKEDCIPNKETLKMSMLIYNTFKSCCRLWRESEIAPYIRILMRTLWSLDPAENPPITLRIKWTQSMFRDIPVGAVQVIHWIDLIDGMIDRLYFLKMGLCIWYKKWLVELYLIHLYQQILKYFVSVLDHTVKNELTPKSVANKPVI